MGKSIHKKGAASNRHLLSFCLPLRWSDGHSDFLVIPLFSFSLYFCSLFFRSPHCRPGYFLRGMHFVVVLMGTYPKKAGSSHWVLPRLRILGRTSQTAAIGKRQDAKPEMGTLPYSCKSDRGLCSSAPSCSPARLPLARQSPVLPPCRLPKMRTEAQKAVLNRYVPVNPLCLVLNCPVNFT